MPSRSGMSGAHARGTLDVYRLGVRMKPTRTEQRQARRALLRQIATVAFALGLATVTR